jgi:thiol-disulfide isomerase/thioredoxin
MAIRNIEFTELDREISKAGKSHLDLLASETGRVYVVAISRDKCPACERQKPRMDELAKSTAEKHGKKVAFIRIRVKYPTEKDEESSRSKEVLGHYFYPTNLILVRTKDKGAIELYRNVSPRMSELKRSIKTAVEIAERLEKA